MPEDENQNETGQNEISRETTSEVFNTKKPPKSKFLIILVLVLVLLVVFGAGGFYYLSQKNKKKSQVTKKETPSCGTLTTEDGKMDVLVPISPVLVGNVTVANSDDKKFYWCLWTFNGKYYGKTPILKGKCVLKGTIIKDISINKASYTVSSRNCQSNATIKATGLTQAEKDLRFQIKLSGEKPEDRNQYYDSKK